MTIIHIGGAKGVGKTTVVGELSSFSIPDHTLFLVTMSELLYHTAEKRNNKSWSQLDSSERIEARKYIGHELLMLPCDVVVLDSHYIDMVEDKFMPIVPKEVSDLIDVYIVLEAIDTEVLSRRIMTFGIRERDLSIDNIRSEIAAEKIEAVRLATETRKPIHILDNIVVRDTARNIFNITENYLHDKEREVSSESIIRNRERR